MKIQKIFIKKIYQKKFMDFLKINIYFIRIINLPNRQSPLFLVKRQQSRP